MIKLHTYKEQMEHIGQNLFMLNKLHAKDISNLKEIGDFLPVGLLLNDHLNRNIYMNKVSENKLRYSRQELDLLGENYVNTIVPEQDHREYLGKQIEQFYKRNDYSEILNLPQKITPKNKPPRWMFICSKLWKPANALKTTTRIVIAVCVDEMGISTQRICRVLNDNIYIRKHFRKFASLTKREKEILALVALGNNNPQIAEQLFISRHTVEQHRKNINKKLEFKTYRELILFAEIFELI